MRLPFGAVHTECCDDDLPVLTHLCEGVERVLEMTRLTAKRRRCRDVVHRNEQDQQNNEAEHTCIKRPKNFDERPHDGGGEAIPPKNVHSTILVKLLTSVDFCVFLSVAFSALTLLVGRQEGHAGKKTDWWGTGMVICLE